MSGLGPGSASSSELNAATGSNSFNQAPTGPEEKRFPAASAHGSRLGVANLRSSASPWGSREVRVDARLQGVEIPIADDGMIFQEDVVCHHEVGVAVLHIADLHGSHTCPV